MSDDDFRLDMGLIGSVAAETGDDAEAYAAPFLWFSREVVDAIHCGDDVPKSDLAGLLKVNSWLAPAIRKHIADRLDGSVKAKPGRPKALPYHANEDGIRRLRLALRVMELWEANTVAGKPGYNSHYRQALIAVSRATDVSVDTLDKYVYPRD